MKKPYFSTLFLLFLLVSLHAFAQKTAIYTDDLREYNHAVALYKNRDFVAAQYLFSNLKDQFERGSEKRANCAYYEAFSAIRLGEPQGDEMMREFVERYPTSTKQNTAFLEVGDYYFKNGKYAYALKWYNRVETRNLSWVQEEEFNFKYAYGLFVVKSYPKAKEYFQKLLTSPEYGAQAKYYYGFIAYQDDDYDNADRYLSEVADDKSLGRDVPYYMANIKFKSGQFEEAIEIAEPFLDKANRTQHSEVSKIIGESYFNLNKFAEAIPHLQNYKGKKGRWNNTDYYLLGYAHYMQKDYKSAIANFNKIIGGDNAVSQNAYYHLAECYLKTDLKTEALNAFRNASQMDFNPKVKEDAWLNYAKLSYEIGNPYKSVPSVLQEFLAAYPKSEAAAEIEDLLISAYITSNDFQGALEALKGKKASAYLDLYQKVSLYRGLQLYNDGNIDEAIANFNNAIELPRDPSTTARAVFWKAESAYRKNNFQQALEGYEKFDKMSKSDTLAEIEDIDYNMAYAYFKLKDYNRAGDLFQAYIDTSPEQSDKRNDSYLRLGDAFFVSSNYNKAISAYNHVIREKGIDIDYAHYQRAMSYGFISRNADKIDDLEAFLKAYPRSNLRDDAYYELGNSYVIANQNEAALKTYDLLLANHKRSSYVPKALLKKGLIYYNIEKDNNALDTYRRIVNEFPNTEEAKQAVSNARQIYVDLGRVDEYADWVKNVDFINVTDADLDNDMYESAEKQYLLNNRKKAIPAFRKYLDRLPNGLHALQANFYLAECLYSEKELAASETYYLNVINQERNEFTEQALARLSQVYLEADMWMKAMPILERLEEQADFPQNITFAQSNLMKGYYAQENYVDAVRYAEKVLERPKLEKRIQSDAKIIIARSAFKTGDESKARAAYAEVQKIATGEIKAETLYYEAYFKHQDEDFEASNKVLQTLVADYSAYKYYGSKGLIIMAKNFYALGDAYQASYILESVIKNFKEFKDVVEEARSELQKVKANEAKTNESVNPDGN
ncbi:tetratricopeptide repeat protein [Flavobacteriaceae bacterium F08102]|nr:tetratricopeptide repeat protein [Flavobacteriaceae bacterium F08102]